MILRPSRFFPLLLLSASLAHAADPKVVVAPVDLFNAPEVAEIDATQSAGDAFEWISVSGKPFKADSNGKKIYFAPTPGKHDFLLLVVGVTDGKVSLVKHPISVHIPFPPPPRPTPVPDPVPDPTPQPVPDPPKPVPVVTGHLFAQYIADASKPIPPSNAALKTSQVVKDAVRSADASFRWYQSDEAEPTQRGLMAYANRLPTATTPPGPGLPCLLIQTADGKIVGELKAPTEADIAAELKRLRGIQ